MRENKVKRALQRGETVIGTMITEARSPAIVQVLAAAGLDFVFIDMEHGPYSLETVSDLIRVARLSGISPLVRVPDPLYHLLARPLDAGAQGLMVPRVETVEQVEHIISSTKYRGERGCSTFRSHTDFQKVPLRDFIEWADAETMVILQIERERAVANIEALLSVPGVDAALIGPNDLSISLGLPGQANHPLVLESIEKVLSACLKLGLPCGIHLGNIEALKGWMRKGMRLLTYSSEINFIYEAALSAVKELRAEAEGMRC